MRCCLLFSTFILALMFIAGPASAARIIVTIDGLHSANGNVFVGLYASPNKFLHGNECDAFKKVRASAGPIIIAFDNLPPGTYAVGAYHDENGNGHLDTSPIGLPVEGYALSNVVRAILAAPRFTDAAFTVGGGDKPIALHIRY